MASFLDTVISSYLQDDRIAKLNKLILTKDELERLYGPYTRLGLIVENNLPFLAAENRVYVHFTSLNELLTDSSLKPAAHFARLFANDLLIFSSVYPSILLKYNGMLDCLSCTGSALPNISHSPPSASSRIS
jgi:hypothetical protein